MPASWDDPLACGSSPLTRGKLVSPSLSCRGLGLIPAHAGKTVTRWSRTMTTSAHPRSRGENASVPSSRRGMTGSSPLTRGKPAHHGECPGLRGLIPAHAGKTFLSFSAGAFLPAHPRSRGENPCAPVGQTFAAGSSPLTRGKLPGKAKSALGNRLIPAHAGKTISEHANSDPAQAHPRSRGENVTQRRNAAASGGSSPLTRGKRQAGQDCLVVEGLIPAHAGKTRPIRAFLANSPAHPRSRGENADSRTAAIARYGSSPLTRGKHP